MSSESQKPKFTPEQLTRILKEEKSQTTGSCSYPGPVSVSDIPLAGETRNEKLLRIDRERALQNARQFEKRRVYTGQILPVFLDGEEE